ncbi:hypothetical protein AVEN_69327-1 [Araneus ventricosus]|uniref:Uncharacterized protein n=1 Tax=Araneus ventricosus TaxID=182803 RepID=A0A4Y2K4Y8_ARAVE|nr:hypothetical protein AVEN_69327-1 [Araneus ventricosus]
MTKTTPELAPHSPSFGIKPAGGCLTHHAPGTQTWRFSVESSFGPGALRIRNRNLTTRPPRPLLHVENGRPNLSGGTNSRRIILGLFRNFEPRSDDEDDTRAGNPYPKHHIKGKAFAHDVKWGPRPTYPVDFQWNRIPNLELSAQKSRPYQ